MLYLDMWWWCCWWHAWWWCSWWWCWAAGRCWCQWWWSSAECVLGTSGDADWRSSQYHSERSDEEKFFSLSIIRTLKPLSKPWLLCSLLLLLSTILRVTPTWTISSACVFKYLGSLKEELQRKTGNFSLRHNWSGVELIKLYCNTIVPSNRRKWNIVNHLVITASWL